jgi:hypothetical protein
MKHSTKVMPVAAAVTALSTIACCLPISLTTALGLAGLSMVMVPMPKWFMGLSMLCRPNGKGCAGSAANPGMLRKKWTPVGSCRRISSRHIMERGVHAGEPLNKKLSGRGKGGDGCGNFSRMF